MIISTQKNGLAAMSKIQFISLTNKIFLEIYLLKKSDLKYFLTKSWQKTEDDDHTNHKNNKKNNQKR